MKPIPDPSTMQLMLSPIDGHDPVDGTDQLPTALLTTKTTFDVVGPVVMPANNIIASYAS